MPSLREKIINPTVVRVFAIIGLIATLVILLGVVSYLRLIYEKPSEPDNVIVTFDLDQPIVEESNPSPLDLLSHGEESIPFLDILEAIDRAGADPHVKGIAVSFGSTEPPLAMAEELQRAFAHFRASGKLDYAYATTYGDFGAGSRDYLVASAFDNIWLQPVGAVSLSGIALETPFGKTALDKLGVKGDFLQREEYKSVMESFTRDDYSPPVRENLQSMIDSLSDQIASSIADGRKWDVAKVKQLMQKGPFTADEALKEGLVTHLGYASELEDEIKKKAGEDMQEVGFEDYIGYENPKKHSDKEPTHVALIHGDGLITDHASGPADIGGEDVMAADEVAGAFDAAADDKSIKAIIFRIDSPGGSPSASETIRAALLHAQKAGKPVIVSMGGVAASGGYWVAMSADHIVAEPGTLTGSIGVVAGKFVIGGLLQKLGVTLSTLSTGGNAGMFSPTEEFTPEQRARMNALLDETYHTFMKDVSDARKIPLAKMPDIAKGRVWTGAQAVKVGLVDELGGYDVTLAALRKKLNLTSDDQIALEEFPAPVSLTDKVMKVLKGIGVESAMIRSALVELGRMQALVGLVVGEVMNFRPLTIQMPLAAKLVAQ